MKFKLPFLLIILPLSSISQDFYSDFLSHCESNDTVKQLEVLEKWESKAPNDPELFTSYFNYHFLKAKQEILTITDTPPQHETIVIQDDSGNPQGYFGGDVIYDDLDIQKALDWIDKGIEEFPNRLDMRFGKCYSLSQLEDWDGFTKELIRAIDFSAENNNQWKWSDNLTEGYGEEFFLSTVQSYQLQIYDTMDDSLLTHMRKVALKVIEHYPENIESISNISITYLIEGNNDEALKWLTKAEEKAPTDPVILSNIAHAYHLKEMTDESISYYEKIIELGDPNYLEFAKQRIEELKN